MPPIPASLIPQSEKVKHVKKAGQDREHHCHWPGCVNQCPPAMWGCKSHWFKLPKRLRDAIWQAYRPGQEKDMRPSREYLKIAHEVQEWITENYSCKACEGSGQSSAGDNCFPCNGSGVEQR